MIRSAIIAESLASCRHMITQLHSSEDFEVDLINIDSKSAGQSVDDLPVTTSLDSVLRRRDIELVFLEAGITGHMKVSLRCLEAGKHLIIEPHFGLTAKSLEELESVARQHDLRVFLYLDGGFEPTFRRLLHEHHRHGSGLPRQLYSLVTRHHLQKHQMSQRSPDSIALQLLHQCLLMFGPPRVVGARPEHPEHGHNTEQVRPGVMVKECFSAVLVYPGMTATITADFLARNPLERFLAVYPEATCSVKTGQTGLDEAQWCWFQDDARLPPTAESIPQPDGLNSLAIQLIDDDRANMARLHALQLVRIGALLRKSLNTGQTQYL